MKDKPTVYRSPFEGTGFELLDSELADTSRAIATTRTELQTIEEQRKEAIAAAELPFKQPLQEARTQLTELEKATSPDAVAERIRELDLDEISLTALDIILRSSRLSILEFAEGIRNLKGITDRDQYNASRAIKQLKTLGGFRSFMSDLEAITVDGRSEGLHVGVFSVRWQEETDAQADWEGRNSSTGIFVKQVDATFGIASPDNVSVDPTDISGDDTLMPVWQPKSILLGLTKVLVIRGYSDWGEPKAELIEKPEATITLLSAPTDQERAVSGTMAIDWIQSTEGGHNVVNATTQSSHKDHFIVWGDRLDATISKLATDQKVVRGARHHLPLVKNALEARE